MMLHIGQIDKRWSGLKLGSTTCLMGRYGCLTVCMSMLTSLLGPATLPSVFAACVALYGVKPGTYGQVQYKQLGLVTQLLKFKERLWVRNDLRIQADLKADKKYVVLCVNNGSHFVVATDWDAKKKDYRIIDAYDGGIKYAIETYHNITGSVHFSS